IQKWINFWFSSAVELFGGEISSNAADYFATGLKGRYREMAKYEDHRALDGTYELLVPKDGKLVKEEVPLRTALNEVLRDEYVADCERAVRKWNHVIKKGGLDFELKLPSRRFNRTMGIYAGMTFDVDGNPITPEEFERRRSEWLPTPEDRAYVASLMQPVYEPGKIANWIAPPKKGINGQPFEFEYVRL
ncbi:MAG TPA: benzoyl-CoA 2,3-epoxidase subunit BoxB, partial [Sandaracinaceae bacterium]